MSWVKRDFVSQKFTFGKRWPFMAAYAGVDSDRLLELRYWYGNEKQATAKTAFWRHLAPVCYVTNRSAFGTCALGATCHWMQALGLPGTLHTGPAREKLWF